MKFVADGENLGITKKRDMRIFSKGSYCEFYIIG